MTCNIPTCRSQDPRDCDGCAGREPVFKFVKVGNVIAVIEEDQGLSYKLQPIFGTLNSNVLPKSYCEVIKNEALLHAIAALQKFDNEESEISKDTRKKRYEVLIGISTKSYLSCGPECPYLEARPGDPAKCLLFAENVGSSFSPCRCRACEKFVSALSENG